MLFEVTRGGRLAAPLTERGSLPLARVPRRWYKARKRRTWLARIVTPELEQQLRYVRCEPGEDLSRFPDFLIVGPQRTGTTWLHAHLRFHPQVLLSEPKELFFFSRIKHRPEGKFQSDSLSWYLQFFRDRWPWWLYKTYFCLRHYGEWYRPIVKGEATASYAALDGDVIREIVLLNPAVKVILMVRDPIERAWSHAKKDLARNRGRTWEEVSEHEIEAFFCDPYQLRCAQYTQNIRRWGEALQPGHLLVGLFDDIARCPEDLLLAVMRFLGVRDDRRYIQPNVASPVNPTAGLRIPAKYRAMLGELLQDEIVQLEREFGLSWSGPHGATGRSFVYSGGAAPNEPGRATA